MQHTHLILFQGVCDTMKKIHYEPVVDREAIYRHLASCDQCKQNAKLVTTTRSGDN